MHGFQSRRLGDCANEVLSSFSDESKQEISDHHESESSSEEVVEEKGIS